MKISEHRLRQCPGSGVLARYGDLVLLCEAAPGHDEQIRDLLSVVAGVAGHEDGGSRLGRTVARALTRLGPDAGFPALCAFGPVGDGMAVLVHGHAEVTVAAAEGEMQLAGRDAITLVDRVVREPVTSIRATLGTGRASSPVDQWCELESGVVRADALVYGPRDTVATSVATSPRTPEPPAPEPPAGTPPLPAPPAEPAASEPTDERPGDTRVQGVNCRNSHFNDPAVAYCTVCGLGLTQSGRMPVLGDRPQLGVLVLDDGSAVPLTDDVVLGRMPEVDDARPADRAITVRLDHPTVSRVHARIQLDGWQVRVADAGSANGTFRHEPGRPGWIPVPPGSPALLRPGGIVALGHRQLRYDSYRRED